MFGQMLDAESLVPDELELPDIVIRCSECRGFAHFVRANEKGGKNRKAHFKHSKQTEVSPLCEKRVKGYTQETVKAYNKKQSERRIRFIRQRFWQMFSGYYKSANWDIDNFLEINGRTPVNRDLGKLMAKQMREELEAMHQERREDLKKAVSNLLAGGMVYVVAQESDNTALIVSTALQKRFCDLVRLKLDGVLQQEIALDVLDFLKYTKSALPIVESLFLLAICTVCDTLKDVIVGMTERQRKLAFYRSEKIIGFRSGIGREVGTKFGEIIRNEDGNVGLNLGFLTDSGNQQVLYHYCVQHILIWIAMVPWNLIIEKKEN